MEGIGSRLRRKESVRPNGYFSVDSVFSRHRDQRRSSTYSGAQKQVRVCRVSSYDQRPHLARLVQELMVLVDLNSEDPSPFSDEIPAEKKPLVAQPANDNVVSPEPGGE
jgi:hypothetical protein